MRYLEILVEAIDYSKMFADPIFAEKQSSIQSEIAWAKRTLKKEDRVVWYLRHLRLALLKNTPEYAAELAKYQKKSGTTLTDDPMRFKRELEHFASLDIDSIKRFNFGYLSPQELIKQLNDLEDEYIAEKNSNAKLIDNLAEPDKTPIIEFPDGYVWWNLNIRKSSVEAEAMGHCGNAASCKMTDTVLSLRKPVKVGKQTHWQPCLTFILDQHTGYLGEMKGRGNEKPAAKYHPYIIALLKNPIVRGIAGGGYAPENNFDLGDLPEATAEQLIKEKPCLGGPVQMYKIFGDCEKTRQSIEVWSDMVIGQPIKYSESDNGFVIKNWSDVASLIDACGNDTARWAIKIVDGEDYLNLDISADNDSLETLLHQVWKTDKELFRKIQQWTFDNCPDSIQEKQIESPVDLQENDIVEISEWENNQLNDALHDAYRVGYESGTMHEIYKALEKAIADTDHLYYEKTDTGNIMWDGEIKYLMSTGDIVDKIQSEGQEDLEYYGFEGSDGIEIDMQSPHYGFGDYHDKAALEALEEQLDYIGIH